MRRVALIVTLLCCLITNGAELVGAFDRAHQLAKAAGTEPASPKKCSGSASMEKCHDKFPAGCNRGKRSYDSYLDFLKNQRPSPDLEPMRFLTQEDFNSLENNRPSALSTSNH